MGFVMPRIIYRFALPIVTLLLVVVTMIVPLGKSALNTFVGDKVTVEYKATVVSIEGDHAIIVWSEDKVSIFVQGTSYVLHRETIDLTKYKHVKVGDTFTVAVTEPGLLKKFGSKNQRAVEVKKHNVNFIKYSWRKLFD